MKLKQRKQIIKEIIDGRIYKCRDQFEKDNRNEDPIHLVTQFYIDSDSKRQKELVHVIKKNIFAGVFKSIVFLNEREYTRDEMQLTADEFKSITQIVIGKWITYKDGFDYAAEHLKGYIVLSNLDIFFDDSILLLRKSMLSQIKSVYCLNRYDMISETESKLDGNVWSQDTWIMHSDYCKPDDKMDIQFGKPGCDNAIAYVFKKLGYKLFNEATKIKSYHYHLSEKRNYHKIRDAVKKDYLWIVPV